MSLDELAKLPTYKPDMRSIGSLRHACHACGTCCQGWTIELLDDAEIARVDAAGAALGVAAPVVDGALRRVDGACVFLTRERLCRIHAELGAEVKPLVCQWFPRRVTKTERGFRLGLDPACTSTARTWLDGPSIDPLPAMQEDRVFPRDDARSEAGIMRLVTAPDASIAAVVAGLTGDGRAVPELPPAFARRLAEVLRDMDLASVVGVQGDDIARRLAHLVPYLATLDASAPPPWAGVLAPGDEPFALEVLRRQLYLRLGDPTAPPFLQALFLLAGVIGLGWAAHASHDHARLQPALSSWSRIVRTPAFWQRLVPTVERARWLVSGSEP